MRDKVLAWMRAQAMTQPGDTVICAVSGGADSVCMLHVLLSLREELGLQIQAAHFNHQLRGEEAARDEAFVRSLCEAASVPLLLGSGDVRAYAQRTHTSIEEAARILRYGFFATLPGTVATAHTQDDNLETVLLNLTRGTGLAGLCGIPPRRDRLIRPMLVCTRGEIEAYLSQNRHSYVTDSTNLQPDARRNRLRQSVIPLLKAENPSLAQTVFRMCRLLQTDEAALAQQAELALNEARCEGGLQCGLLARYPEAIRTRALRLFAAPEHIEKLSSAHLQSLDRLLVSASPSARLDLPAGLIAAREYDRLVLTHEAASSPFAPVFLEIGNAVELPELRLRVRCEIQDYFPKKQNSLSTFAIKYDTIALDSPILLRPRQTHDTMRVSGGRRTLKKLMIDRKIPAAQRMRLPVAVDARGVLGVYQIGVNLDRAASAGERAVMITIEELEKED